MARADYGCIVHRNGENIQTEWMMDMKEALGFELAYVPDFSGFIAADGSKNIYISNRYMGYAGTKDFLVCFYKKHFIVVENGICTTFYQYGLGYTFAAKYVKTKTGIEISVKSLDGYDRFYCEFTDDAGTKWSAIYGYGVEPDIRTFERTHKNYGIKGNEYHRIKRFMQTNESLFNVINRR